MAQAVGEKREKGGASSSRGGLPRTTVCSSLGGVCEIGRNFRRRRNGPKRLIAGRALAADDDQPAGADPSEADKGDAAPEAAGQELCLLNGIGASLGSGFIGWVIGFGSGIVRLKVEGSRFRSSIQKANTSSKTFGLMGGMYTFTACAARKLRGKDDAINLAIAGCASGIALGWDGGPVGALQSCAGMGAFSWFFDGKRLAEKA